MVYEQDAGQLTPEQLKRLFPHFTGEIQQIPPMTSAVRHQGTKLYQLARKGIEVERMPRQVTIHNLELVSWKKEQDQPVALLDVSCSAGTYIRTLCTDMGDALGCGAYMRFLLRTKAGSFGIQDAYTLEEILAKSREDILAGMLMPIERVLAHFPMVMVKESAIRSVAVSYTHL